MRQLSLNKQTAQGHRAYRVCERWTWTQACAVTYRAIPTMLCGCHCQGYLWQPHLPIEGLLAWILQCFCGSFASFHPVKQMMIYLFSPSGNGIEWVPKVMDQLGGAESWLEVSSWESGFIALCLSAQLLSKLQIASLGILSSSPSSLLFP